MVPKQELKTVFVKCDLQDLPKACPKFYDIVHQCERS
jgi:hypothetical protein